MGLIMRDRTVYLLEEGEELAFPPVEQAKSSGLLAVGGDLSAARLIKAYSQGIFPWYGKDCPVMWWSPDPRCVLIPAELKISRSLQRAMNKNPYTITQNKAFLKVINFCSNVARPGQDGTWLQPEMIEAYYELHKLGYAHSVEAWQENRLVGGLYGIALGGAFFGESMFHLEPNASKIAFVSLAKHLLEEGFTVVDCQQTTSHMLSMGAKEISRADFIKLLEHALEK